MAKYGQWMLKSLRIQYCDLHGSSRGVRELLQQHLPAFKSANPQVQVSTEVRRNHFPFIEAQYGNEGRKPRTVGVKHLGPEEILQHMQALRDSAGHNTRNRVPARRIISRNPSIQGSWGVSTWQHLRSSGSSAAAS